MTGELKEARQYALHRLVRREYSCAEMQKKLMDRGYESALIEKLLSELIAGNLLSDERYTEGYVRSRYQRGYGPLRIQGELRERGITDEMIARHLRINDVVWFDQASLVRRKRFGPLIPEDIRERSRQTRFLQYRGFTGEQIREAFKHGETLAH